jgi:hypothetical protein
MRVQGVGGGSVSGVGTGAGCAARVPDGYGFDGTRCSRCRRSHALLTDLLLERRLDEVQVIGQALALSINELAHRGSW